MWWMFCAVSTTQASNSYKACHWRVTNVAARFDCIAHTIGGQTHINIEHPSCTGGTTSADHIHARASTMSVYAALVSYMFNLRTTTEE